MAECPSMMEMNRMHSQSVDISPIHMDGGLRRRAATNIVPMSALNIKPQYDCNCQMIRQKLCPDTICDSVRESLKVLRMSEMHTPGIVSIVGGDDQLAIIAVAEPELPSVLTEQYDSWSYAQKAALQCCAVTAFVFFTWGLAFRGYAVGASLAASSTATTASVLVPDMIIFASIGAYAGMTGFSKPAPVVLLAFLTCISGLCFERFGLFPGKGGRLGVAAFLASVLSMGIVYKSQPSVVNNSSFYDSSVASYARVNGILVLNMLFSNLVGISLTYALRKLRPLLSPVVAGNAASMMLILILGSFFQNPLSDDVRDEAAGCILQGSFAGMSSFAILTNVGDVAVLGVLSGLVTLLLYPLFPHGVGGKRGLMAFIAVHVFLALVEAGKMMADRLKRQDGKAPPAVVTSSKA